MCSPHLGVRVREGVVVVMVTLFSEDVQFSGLNILFCLFLSLPLFCFFSFERANINFPPL